MKKYKVLVTEVYQKKVAVMAANEKEAKQRVSDAWNNTEFILEPEDCFIGAEFYVSGLANKEEDLETVASVEECES